MPFEFEKLGIDGLVLIKPKIFGDNRGLFLESYKKSEFVENGINCEFVQDNYSISNKGVLRGLHYQVSPKSQAKLVRCTRGRIFDVVVDLRKNSKTFLKHIRIELSGENQYMLFIPEGFAHGFVVLSEQAELLYKTSEEFAPDYDRGILWCDSDINVDWGIDFEPVLSDKDKVQPSFKDIDMKELN